MRLSLWAIALASSAALLACNKDSGSDTKAAPSSSAASAPAPSAGTPAATTAQPAAAAPANATAAGIKTGELVAAVCDTIAKDSECGEIVVMSEGDKGKTLDMAKKAMCPTAVAGTACPSAKMVATCRVMKDVINHYYADGPKSYTKDTAKTACDKNHGHIVE